jgi:hypothetical protein
LFDVATSGFRAAFVLYPTQRNARDKRDDILIPQPFYHQKRILVERHLLEQSFHRYVMLLTRVLAAGLACGLAAAAPA